MCVRLFVFCFTTLQDDSMIIFLSMLLVDSRKNTPSIRLGYSIRDHIYDCICSIINTVLLYSYIFKVNNVAANLEEVSKVVKHEEFPSKFVFS